MTAVFLKRLNMSISASWVVLEVLVLRVVLKRVPKTVWCVLLGLAAVRLICPFSIESIFSLIPSAETIPKEIMYVQEPAIQSGIVALNSFGNPTISEKLAPTPEMSVNPMQCIIWGITVFWIAGMTIMIVYGLTVTYGCIVEFVPACMMRRKKSGGVITFLHHLYWEFLGQEFICRPVFWKRTRRM